MTTERPPLAERMSAVARELEGQDAASTLDLAARTAVGNVGGADAAAISVVAKGGRIETLASTEQFAFLADQLQYELGEGPCLDAVHQERVVHCPDLAEERRWSRWGPRAAQDLGVGSMLCLQLFTQQDVVGALNLYSQQPHGFTPEDRDDALALAAHVAVAVAGARKITQLHTALDSRTVIGQAVGIIMERYGLDADRAFGVLGRLSSHSNVKLREVAVEVVSTRHLPGT